MSEDDVRVLWHGKARALMSSLTARGRVTHSDGKNIFRELDSLILSASRIAVKDPDRLDEAMMNFDKLIREIKSQAFASSHSTVRLRDALIKLCPIFPFC
ncbi:hypothetical protein [Pseudomonas koreensis]|uniref:Uncharacterized protein n=1 Tax=Pseudomonas koreensis TaxID=198620 RepID=A0A9X3BAF5_9PSED|nr:hypothetical protein [Pseudomonas koreensis]MCU7247249.1 hypothetical protein [Pseudomonas koreensis]